MALSMREKDIKGLVIKQLKKNGQKTRMDTD